MLDLLPGTSCPIDCLTGPAKVIDGDAIVLAEQLVRLHGIDVLELDQTFW